MAAGIALEAAGLNPDDVSQYRRWDHVTIVGELRRRHRKGEALSSGSVQQNSPALHAAAVRHFGDYDAALVAAKLDPHELRKRQRWSKEEVIKALKTAARSGKRMSSTQARHEIPAAHGAAVRLFGSFTSARDAAGIKYSRPERRKRSNRFQIGAKIVIPNPTTSETTSNIQPMISAPVCFISHTPSDFSRTSSTPSE